ncbi:hypothetical protein OSH08_13770 [Kaistia geumhonensis]|uniref:CBM-cenC domain-containing protein n=1 Tax=Kaistia geumhonensis TaxID=410839 RepID=A0ABU0M156_9HYPH|nr:hypothetical protein [Kaistia geumhonensis]MCX5480083.1 hypothetical protein [Kaistia geumhonensis]MDQ0514689.1 hypothetical protein [Kaistia geumhonensis]
MDVSQPSSRRRSGRSKRPGSSRNNWLKTAVQGGVIVVLTLVIWLGVILLSRGSPDRADDPGAFMRGDSTAGLLRQASGFLTATPPDPAAAIVLAREALVKSPLNTAALTILAQAEEAAGNAAIAAPLYRLASDLNKHLSQPLIWAINDANARKDYESVVRYADLFLRSTPTTTTAAAAATIDLLVGVASTAPTASLIVPYLKNAPPWRDAYLNRLADTGVVGAFENVVAGIDYREIAFPWRKYLNRLVSSGEIATAYVLNYGLLNPDSSDPVPYLFDGGFERGAADNLPFAWTISNLRSATIGFDPTTTHGGRYSLALSFTAPVSFHNVYQTMMLPAGSYRLNGFVKMSDLKAATGLQWTIFCKGSPPYVIGTSPLFSGNADWTAFTAPFVVPATGCEAQTLRLDLAERIAADRKIEGRIWFDDLSIQGEG